jgi:hypothetical protein
MRSIMLMLGVPLERSEKACFRQQNQIAQIGQKGRFCPI